MIKRFFFRLGVAVCIPLYCVRQVYRIGRSIWRYGTFVPVLALLYVTPWACGGEVEVTIDNANITGTFKLRKDSGTQSTFMGTWTCKGWDRFIRVSVPSGLSPWTESYSMGNGYMGPFYVTNQWSYSATWTNITIGLSTYHSACCGSDSYPLSLNLVDAPACTNGYKSVALQRKVIWAPYSNGTLAKWGQRPPVQPFASWSNSIGSFLWNDNGIYFDWTWSECVNGVMVDRTNNLTGMIGTKIELEKCSTGQWQKRYVVTAMTWNPSTGFYEPEVRIETNSVSCAQYLAQMNGITNAAVGDLASLNPSLWSLEPKGLWVDGETNTITLGDLQSTVVGSTNGFGNLTNKVRNVAGGQLVEIGNMGDLALAISQGVASAVSTLASNSTNQTSTNDTEDVERKSLEQWTSEVESAVGVGFTKLKSRFGSITGVTAVNNMIASVNFGVNVSGGTDLGTPFQAGAMPGVNLSGATFDFRASSIYQGLSAFSLVVWKVLICIGWVVGFVKLWEWA